MGKHTHTEAEAPGRLIHWAARYDLLAWLFTFGRERGFREKILRLALLEPGESVLDVGCGTGTLAMLAKQQVGPEGAVHGIDASPEMIARAGVKARKAGLDITFKKAAAQALPFRDAEFDVVTTTLMLHHLSTEARQQLAHEIRRILKPTGRVLAVDFAQGQASVGSFIDHFHRHGVSKLEDIVTEFRNAGLHVVATGAVGTKGLQFVLATAATDATGIADRFAGLRTKESLGMTSSWQRRHLLSLSLALAIAGLAALHVGAPWWLSRLGLDAFSNPHNFIRLLALIVIVKLGLLVGGLHRWRRGHR